MKISIITPVFNGAASIEKTIQSVISQKRNCELEYIIIDGDSVDGTQAIIQSYKDEIDYFVSEKDNGVYDAMNKGIKNATGDIIGIINADDWYNEGAFLSVEECFRENPKLGIVYSPIDNYLKGAFFNTFVPGNIENLYLKFVLNHPSCFIRKSVYDELGTFNLSYKIAADYDLISRAYSAGFIFQFIDKTLASYSLDGMSGFQAPFSIKVKQLRESQKVSTSRILESEKHYILQKQKRFYTRSYLKLLFTFPLKKLGIITPRRTNKIKNFLRSNVGKLRSDSYGSW